MGLTALYRYYFGPRIDATAKTVLDASDALDSAEAEWQRTSRAHIHGTLRITLWFTQTIGDGTDISRIGLKNDGRVIAFLNVEPGDDLASFSWEESDIRDIGVVASPDDADQPRLTIVGINADDRVVFEDQIELQYTWSQYS
ncbi:hypothetical protein Hbl1158_17060 (plasmid) [Halobaculum sp. CBA1158]|uniref:hypothetical protein n=1 Tax=Halobaculum sp. CBA1158 TaxID=2904243 RepID=UPI001F245DEA|nr:hypothetical protein [Halobaculum sp. CBA1158]UIP01712.1 hypothetical protein Hbl1158_17060 [Halobaculum sp. CBA1158]